MVAGVVSLDVRRGMGYRGELLIRLKADMAWFRRLTSEHAPRDPLPAVIMGRKTWDSLPSKYRPLPGRRNYVLSRFPTDQKGEEGVVFGSNWTTLLAQAKTITPGRSRVFVIGGGEVFRIAFPDLQTLYVTELHKEFTADTFFPPFLDEFPHRKILEQGEEAGISYEIVQYQREPIIT